MNLYVKDTPLWYRPPIGPAVKITLSYNSQSANSYRFPFGKKWQLNYGSYLVEGSHGNAANVTVYMPDGRRDAYITDGSGGFITPYKSHNILSKISSGRYELRFPDDTVYVYDIPTGCQQPVLIEIRDPHYVNDNSLKLSFTYDGNGNLTVITDALGRSTILDYNGSLITQVTDPFGRKATFDYDYSKSLLTRITDMGGYAADLTYASIPANSTRYFLTSIANARGAWQFYTEPADHVTPPGGTYTPDMYYPAPGGAMYENYRLTVTNPLGFKAEYYYNGVNSNSIETSTPKSWHVRPLNYVAFASLAKSNYNAPKTIYNMTKVSNNTFDNAVISELVPPLGTPRTYSYSASGDLASDSYDGKTSQYDYNALGWPTTRTEPNGAVTTMTYADNNIDLISTTISNGGQTLGTETRTYNSTHDVLSVTDRMGYSTSYTYNSYGQVASVQDALGIVNNYLYDDLHRLTAITRAGQAIQQNTYDSLDRISTYTDATGLTLGYVYNNLDQVTAISYPDGKSKTYQYSTCCPFVVDSVTERSGQTTFYSYDKSNHLLAVTDPAGGVTGYGYDVNGNRARIIDPKGKVTRFYYDFNNRLTKKQYADGSYESFSYAGAYPNPPLVATRTNARKITTNYTYTNLGKLAAYFDNNGPETSFGYDEFGRKTSASSPAGSINYVYDADSRLVGVAGPWAGVAYQYDALGRRIGLTRDNGQSASYSYDSLNRLTGVNVGGAIYTYGYTGASPLVRSLTRPDGSVTAYDYDALNRLTQMTTTVSGVVVNSYAYTYNDQDLRDTEDFTEPEPRAPYGNYLANYTYNSVNQLTRISDPGARPLAYDWSGNLTQGYTPAGYAFNAGYDSDNHLTSLSYTDGAGVANNIVFTYLEDNLLKKQHYQNGSLVGERRYVYDGFQIVQERDSNNNVVNDYTYGQGLAGGIGDLLQLTQGGAWYSYLYDGKGNVTALLDGVVGNVAQTYQYDPFGVLKSSSGSINQPMRFSTKPYDAETGLSYYGYRFYAPAIGRWMTRDPIGEKGGINLYGFVDGVGKPFSGTNLYTFADNNPVNRIDPEGLFAVPCELQKFYCQRLCVAICFATMVAETGPFVIPLCLISCKIACDSAFPCKKPCH